MKLRRLVLGLLAALFENSGHGPEENALQIKGQKNKEEGRRHGLDEEVT